MPRLLGTGPSAVSRPSSDLHRAPTKTAWGGPRRRAAAPFERALRGFGYQMTAIRPPWPSDFDQAEIDLCMEMAPYTMTTPEALVTLVQSTRYVVAAEIPGAIVECGVWRGGSMMAVAKGLLALGQTQRDLYLFDTFEGMPRPTAEDVHWTGTSAAALLAREPRHEGSKLWGRAGLDEVRAAMDASAYPASRVRYVRGRVEDTIPDQAPDEIALLRLDTDWYASTRHELVHLYPRLASNGVLIIDDYGCWQGARQATDEYFRAHAPPPLLVRLDESGVRLAVKPSSIPVAERERLGTAQ